MPAKQQFTYADIAAELGVTTSKFQQFVIEERTRRGKPWKPDACPPGYAHHLFKPQTAKRLMKAWRDRRVLKTWKAKKKK
jgi:hypothetical protein